MKRFASTVTAFLTILSIYIIYNFPFLKFHAILCNFHLKPSIEFVYRVARVQYNEIRRLTDNAQGDAVFALPCCIAAGCSPVNKNYILFLLLNTPRRIPVTFCKKINTMYIYRYNKYRLSLPTTTIWISWQAYPNRTLRGKAFLFNNRILSLHIEQKIFCYVKLSKIT